MEKVVGVVALIACLLLAGRAMPGRMWPVVLAAALGLVLLVVLAEQNGYWPASWKTR